MAEVILVIEVRARRDIQGGVVCWQHRRYMKPMGVQVRMIFFEPQNIPLGCKGKHIHHMQP